MLSVCQYLISSEFEFVNIRSLLLYCLLLVFQKQCFLYYVQFCYVDTECVLVLLCFVC